MTSPTERLLEVLASVRGRLASPDACYDWSSWNGSDDALAELDQIILELRAGKSPPSTVRVLFSATGPIQEVAISSGWGDEFLRLAEACDEAVMAIRAGRPEGGRGSTGPTRA